jgi:hypothetical protein
MLIKHRNLYDYLTHRTNTGTHPIHDIKTALVANLTPLLRSHAHQLVATELAPAWNPQASPQEVIVDGRLAVNRRGSGWCCQGATGDEDAGGQGHVDRDAGPPGATASCASAGVGGVVVGQDASGGVGVGHEQSGAGVDEGRAGRR